MEVDVAVPENKSTESNTICFVTLNFKPILFEPEAKLAAGAVGLPANFKAPLAVASTKKVSVPVNNGVINSQINTK
jgi:hypothetical protein